MHEAAGAESHRVKAKYASWCYIPKPPCFLLTCCMQQAPHVAWPAQVRLFSQSEARRALAAGDVWAWVGPSEELLPAVASSSNVRLVAPASGTTLWADLWVVPAAAGTKGADSAEGDAGERPEPSLLLPLWLEFGLQPARCERCKQM